MPRQYSYQYETSPRKIKPDYNKTRKNAPQYNKRTKDALFNVRMTDASIRQTGLFLPKIDKDENFIRLCCLCLWYSTVTSFHYKIN